MAESEEELKSLLMKVESEKVGLKLNIEKTKIMVSGPVTSWQVDGEAVTDFIMEGLQNHCRWLHGDFMVTAAMKLKDAYSLEDNLWRT